MKQVLLFLGCYFLLTHLSGQGVTFLENPVWKEAVKEAKEQKRLLFVDCYTVWCGPCQGLIRNVFPQKEMGDFYNKHFVNVKYDMEKPNGMAFREVYPGVVECYPTLLFIDPSSGKIVHKFVGSKRVPEMIAEAKKSISGGGMAELQVRYDGGERSFEFMKEYIRGVEKSASRRLEVVMLIDRYLAENDTLKNLLLPEKWAFYSNYLWDIHAGYVQYVMANRQRIERLKFVDKIKLDKDLGAVLRLAVNNLTEITKNDTTKRWVLVHDTLLHRLVRTSLEKLPGLSGREEWCAKLMIHEYLLKRDWEKAYQAVNAAVDFEFRSASHYRWMVYHYMVQESDDRVLLTRILADLKAGQEEGSRRFKNHNYYDRIATVAEKLGMKKEAVAARKECARISAVSGKMVGE